MLGTACEVRPGLVLRGGNGGLELSHWGWKPGASSAHCPHTAFCSSSVSLTSVLRFLCPPVAGCRQIQDLELSSVEVDPCGDAQAAAEGAVLGLYEYDDLKQKKKMAVSAKLHGR